MSESTPTSLVRPPGITILAILAFIGGLFGLCGITIALLAMLGVSAGLAQALNMSGISVAGGILAVLLLASSILGVILYLAFAYGAWTLKPWAWILGVIAEGWALLSVIFKLVNGSTFRSQIIPLVIAAGILVYLFSPEVKKAFGRV